MGLQNVTRSLTGAEKEDGASISQKVEQNFFFPSPIEPSSDKNFEQRWGWWRGWLRSKACKFLASGPNQPRGPRRGGETSASLLNWSHWDPQGSPRRTRRKAIKIWPCGSDERLGGEKAEKKDCFGGERAAQKEQRGTARGDQGETRRVGSSSEGASRRHRRVPAKNQSSEDRHYQLSKPMLHVWSCAQPINRGCIFIMLGSWQPEILAPSELAWDQTLDEAGVVIRSMLGPQRNTRYQSNPDSPQTCPSRQHKHPNVLNKVLWICISFPGPLDVVHSRIEKLLSAGGPSYQKRQMGASCQMWQKK